MNISEQIHDKWKMWVGSGNKPPDTVIIPETMYQEFINELNLINNI